MRMLHVGSFAAQQVHRASVIGPASGEALGDAPGVASRGQGGNLRNRRLYAPSHGGFFNRRSLSLRARTRPSNLSGRFCRRWRRRSCERGISPLRLDLQIVLKTIPVALFNKNAY